MTTAVEAEKGTWFADLLMSFSPEVVRLTGETPEEMISTASWKAFAVSAVAAIPPGPLGYVSIIPELMAVTKIQINLIHQIAEHYGKRGQLNRTIVLLIFANEAGVGAAKPILEKLGKKVIVRIMGAKVMRPILQNIGIKIGARVAQRLAARWIPFILAPVFGALSKSMTTRIGREAQSLFEKEIEIVS